MKSATVLVICLCFLAAEAAKDICRMWGKGVLVQFNKDKSFINLPCKYRATEFKCQGYHVKVTPGQALDSKARFYTKSVWVTIVKEGTSSYWKGRTDNNRVARYFKNLSSRTAFAVKEEAMDSGEGFKVLMYKNVDNYQVSLKVQGTTLKVLFNAYDENDPIRRRKAGVKIICPESTFVEESKYPEAICGMTNDTDPIRQRKLSLGLDTYKQAIMYDLLNSEGVTQTNPQCETAAREFQTCDAGDRATMVKTCDSFLTNPKLVRCLLRNKVDAMDAFIYCMKYKCQGDSDSCFLIQEALDACPFLSVLPEGGECPVGGL